MANRPTGYGLTAEVRNKIESKWDGERCIEVMEWIKKILKDDAEAPVIPICTDKDPCHEALKDGVILCHLINALSPGCIKKVNTSKLALKQIENIDSFLKQCGVLGVVKMDVFRAVDLYEAQNMPQVLFYLMALGKKTGTIRPKESVQDKREFTEEQLRAGEGVIGLQAGSNKGATQAGQNFGKTRAIID